MKSRTPAFFCTSCGNETARWVGRCPSCGEWNTVKEFREGASPAAPRAVAGERAAPVPIVSVARTETARIRTGFAEADNVLGGGIVPGAVVLLAGAPGIGKSTFLLQVAATAAGEGPVLYVTGEESVAQAGMRAGRLGIEAKDLLLLAESDIAVVVENARSLRPRLLILDSVQTAFHPEAAGHPGSVTQVRESAAALSRLAKSQAMAVVLVGHVTKEGSVAGPKVLEHMVDAVVCLEGGRTCRVLRCEKNRFGATEEIGLFSMGARGFSEIREPSRMFLEETTGTTPGSVVCPVAEGNRVLPVEVQALAASSSFQMPRRNAVGVDYNRVVRLCAVVEKHGGVNLSHHDVYVSVAGGLAVREPAVDLAIVAAMASSKNDVPVGADVAMVGEVGLSGEIRRVRDLAGRLRALSRIGVRTVFTPAGDGPPPVSGLEIVRCGSVAGVFNRLRGRKAAAEAAG